jgi:hypothetical protein
VVVSDAGLVLFTGYVVQTPAGTLTGAGIKGTLYAFKVSAISDEVLLDQQSVPMTAGSTGQKMVSILQSLTQRVDPTRLTVAANLSTNMVGQFTADAAHRWSENAGELASIARVSYRVLNGQLTVVPIGSVAHAFGEGAGTLDVSTLSLEQAKVLANDVTVCGESEAQTYVTDVFQGDGTTTSFELTRKPLLVAGVAERLIQDGFNGPAINSVLWQINDPGSRLTLTSTGLGINGGNGLDGQTTLSAIDTIEMGGALVLTAGGVTASAGSDGYIACFYTGGILLQNLFAGFHVKQSGGNTVAVPVINGIETGTPAVVTAGHAYSFRLRYYSREMQRVLSSYYVTGATGQQSFGGAVIASTAALVFEIQDTTGGINQPSVVLYDGSVSVSPGSCVLAAVNSPAFTGSLQSISLSQTGSSWVTSMQTSGAAFTRRLGLATLGSDCRVTATGKLEFYAASVPQNGELITLSYRTAGTSVARLVNTAAVAAQGTAVAPGVSRWIGSVIRPGARSSADCESAALALLAVSTNPAAGWSGKYSAQNLQQSSDVWPGDLLTLQATGLGTTTNVIVRTVTVINEPVVPELLTYEIDFANDWAEDLSIRTSKTVPKTAWLPQTASSSPSTLQNLAALTVNVTASQILVTAGVTASTGGGFEVRRVDWQFGKGSDGTLVLRSPVASFTILREAAIEHYYVRMYDGATPPNYSRFSTEICVSVPL